MKFAIASLAHACHVSVPEKRRRVEMALLGAGVVVALCLRLPFLPSTLEDIDTVNFYLGVHDFNPIAHQPHPPGYPVYIFLAKLAVAVVASDARALGLLSALMSAFSLVPLYVVMKRLGSAAAAALACALTLANPVFWFNGVRPMSDVTGFFVVITCQALLLLAIEQGEGSRRGRTLWHAGVFAGGLAIGVRLQALVLVAPVLLYCAVRMKRIRLAVTGAAMLIAAVLLWLVPLVWYSGGPGPLAASIAQLFRDSLPVEPLVMTWSPRAAAVAAVNVAVAPWQQVGVAAVVLLLAAAGVVMLARAGRRVLATACVLFLPYAMYHFLLQSTETIRYTIPTVPLVAFLASVPATRCASRPWRRFAVTACAVVIFAAGRITLPALWSYHKTPSPAIQALERVTAEAAARPVVVAGHHMFARYLGLLPSHLNVLLTPPRTEWRALGEYWKSGGRLPILFLREPRRTSLMLISRNAVTPQGHWRWPRTVGRFMKGERPNAIELVRIDPPRWFCESGFLVTREAGPPDAVARERHVMYVRPRHLRSTLVVSGAAEAPGSTDVTLYIDGLQQNHWSVDGQFMLHTFYGPLPADDEYKRFSFRTSSPVLFTDVWLDPADTPVVRPAGGFYSPERDETNALFRWIAPRARASIYLPEGPALLSIQGSVPAKYYRRPLKLTLSLNGTRVGSFNITGETFHVTQKLNGAGGPSWGELSIDTSAQFVPDHLNGNGDTRLLSARIYDLRLAPLDGGS